MDKKRKAPRLRFQGFTDDWEQRKFSELVTIERGGSPRPIDKFITKDENGLNWIKIGDAPEQGNYITQTAEKIKPEGLSKTREVHPGDLILSNSMSFGRPYIMAIDGCIHDGWLAIRDTQKNFDLKFLCILLGTDNMLSQYKAMAAGSTVNNLNKELVGGTTVSYPAMDEQIKLGEYFESLDNLITLHQRKCDKLVEYKKGMLQKMFPQNGSSVPEIRFSGFPDDWEQRKCGDMTVELSEYDNLQSGYPLLTSSRNGLMFQRDFRDKTSTDNEDTLFSVVPYGKCTYRHMSDDDIFHFNINTITERGLVSREYPVFDANEDSNLSFLIQYLNSSPEFTKFCSQRKLGGTRTRLYYKNLCEFGFYVPSKAEQDRIATFLEQLDNLITLHQRKVEKIKEYKKGLLQQLFAY